jgi:hypothetical protein
MKRCALCLVLASCLVALASGCKLTRQGYEAVGLGQTQAQVQKVLGAPRYRFDNQWVYTADDARDLTKVEVVFDESGKVVGKSWQNPEKPWENHRQGTLP